LSLRLQYDNVVKKFETKGESVTALNGVSAEVREGELFCLLGPSGCGKTTLLRSTAGLETIDDGKIYYGDTDFSLFRPLREILGWCSRIMHCIRI
jgi:ABC-type sugar transport system ATPase subunit